MRIKKKNVARLASLSVLGAGALGVAASTAEAGDVVYVPLSKKVGFSGGYNKSATWGISSGPTLKMWRYTTWASVPGGTRLAYSVNLGGSGSYPPGFKPGDALPGQKWGALPGAAVSSVRLGLRLKTSRTWTKYVTTSVTTYGGKSGHFSSGVSVTRSHSGTNGNFYKLFQFYSYTNSNTEYGWLYFDQTLSDTVGPDVKLLGMAYNTTGAQIGAGCTDAGCPASGVPEPSTMALTGFAALALGAVGLRRWRAARKPAA